MTTKTKVAKVRAELKAIFIYATHRHASIMLP